MGTRVRVVTIALIVGCIATLSAAGFAAVIVQHQGNTDPLTEGWAWNVGSLGVGTGPVTNDGGCDAWYTDDTISSESQSWGSWAYGLSEAEDASVGGGWKASTRLRVIDPDQIMYAGILFQVNSGTRRWHLDYSQDANGNTVVCASTGSEPGPVHTFSDGGYHLYEIVCDMSTEEAQVYIDGSLWICGWKGYEYAAGGRFNVAWGSGSSCDRGRGNWNMTSFETVPEPTGFVALASALSLLAGFGIRRRR